MDIEDTIRSRYSARKFLPRPVPETTLWQILELAQCTPSWCNTQPWQLVVTRGEATDGFREALHEHVLDGGQRKPDFDFPEAYVGSYRERRKVCGVQLYQALGIGREDKTAAAEQSLQNYRLFDAPHVAIVSSDSSLGVYGALDCGLYVAHFLLAARSLGVDTVAQAALAAYPDFIRAHFGWPAERKVVCGISFGYADEAHPIHGYRTGRVAVAESVRMVGE